MLAIYYMNISIKWRGGVEVVFTIKFQSPEVQFSM